MENLTYDQKINLIEELFINYLSDNSDNVNKALELALKNSFRKDKDYNYFSWAVNKIISNFLITRIPDEFELNEMEESDVVRFLSETLRDILSSNTQIKF